MTLGLVAACFAASWAIGAAVSSGTPPWIEPARGPFSHHLTLGYALVPAAAVAFHRRKWHWATLLSAGILCSGASGPAFSLCLVILSLWLAPRLCLAAGLAMALGILALLTGDPDVSTRMVHWTAGTQLVLEGGAGWGPAEAIRNFQHTESLLSSEIRPEQHPHDSVLQWGILGGLGAWLAWAWLLLQLWKHTGTAGRAALAALGGAALTQDVFGDLEVLRALCAWCLLSGPSSSGLPVSALDSSRYAEEPKRSAPTRTSL